MNRLARYIRKYLWFYFSGILAMVASITLDMFNPRLIKLIVDDVIIGGNMSVFKLALLGLLGITIARAVLGYTKEMMFDIGSSKTIMSLRKKLFDHIQTLSFSFFDKVNTGELMSRVKEDAENVLSATAYGAMLFIEQSIYFLVATTLMLILNWKLALVSLATMPIIAYVAFKLEKHIGQTFDKISDQRAVLNTTAQENIAGVRLVKAFGREKHEIQKFLSQNKVNYDLSVQQAEVFAKYYPKIEFLANIVIVLVTTAGGLLVMGNEISIGMLVAFSHYIYMLIWPMRMIGWLTNILAQCNSSLKKIEKLFEEKPTVKDCDNPIIPENMEGHIVFKNVCFDYNGVPVLKNISMDVKAGSTVAIMGVTGTGKSSIISLIGRYYDRTAGDILIDDIDIKDIELKTLRQQVSVVMQDTFLFSDTIEENIKFGANGTTTEELVNAAKDARVHDFVSEMTEGYATVIGERGIGLSGGQKQRISIARALARKSKILILDDATSALDTETEYEIQKALKNRKGVTKFIIAHRISAVKDADEILILENGEIVERGTHKQLLALKGRYYHTYGEQFSGLLDLDKREVV